MRHQSVVTCSALASGLCGASLALGALSQAVITSPGGFIQAGAYPTSCGCSVIPGADMTATYGLGADFHEGSFSGASSVQQSAAFSSAQTNNGAGGTVSMGQIRMSAYNTSPDATLFAKGAANGGWKETFTVNHPTLGGQAGILIFQIRARGAMQTTAFTGSVLIQTTGYKDNAELVRDAYFNPGNSDPISTDRQRAQWGLASFGQPDSRTVDDIVTMSVPITFGQSFTLGVYAIAQASQRSSGGNGGTSSGTLDFSGNGVTWNGIVQVLVGGQPVSGFTVISATGINWTAPLGGCYANCDGSTTSPVLNVLDFSCFLNKFAAGDSYANCDGSTTPPVLNVLDFSCFLNRFAAGCT